MGGFVAGTPQSLLANTAAITAGQSAPLLEINCETDADGNPVAMGELWVNATAAASGDLEIWLVRLTQPAGEAATNKYLSISIDAGATEDLNIPLQVGIYQLWFKNNDTLNDATVNSVTLKTYTWA